MSETVHLALPYIAAAQAQKHVTHNEALRILDALVLLTVKDRDLSSPPGTPAEGDRYLVNPTGSGEFSGKDNQIAHYRDGTWGFHAPQDGWLCYVEDEATFVAFDSGVWMPLFQNVPLLGIGTVADATNPFSAKLNNVLWTARYDGEGGDGSLRYKFNKEDAADTVSMLFQTDWSGRAEIGLIGDNKLRAKVSADGSAWKDVVTIDESTGHIGLGTSAPEASFHLAWSSAAQPILDQYISGTTAAGFSFRKARGTVGSPAAVENNDYIGAFPTRAWDGSSYVAVGNFRWGVDGTPSTGNVPTRIEFLNFSNSGALSAKLVIGNEGHTRPGADNAYSLGTGSFRWSAVYAVNGTIQTSDARLKTDIADSRLGLAFINALRPVSYRWITGGQDVIPSHDSPADNEGNPANITVSRPGMRTHYGLLAQEVRAALDVAGAGDFGGYIKMDVGDPESEEGLRYDQFIAPLIRAVQELTQRVATLEAQIE
jgi:hypothetical protein